MSAADDTAARAAALDPARSFVVQAPAGSGKTELLIQRYLALLATVEEPEQVVAITFTRKAAAEMRRRVQRALRSAAAGDEGATAHERRTLALARTVVERDASREWSVLAQPQRLRIDTLDAFNVWLAQQLPVLSGGVTAARIADDASDYYRRAARRTVAAVCAAGEPGASLRTLLRGFDDLDALEKLLAALLAKRDQWLPRFVKLDAAQLRPVLEDALRRLVDDELAALAPLTQQPLFAQLRAALRQAATHATDDKVRRAAAPWLQIDAAPPISQSALTAWQGAALLLLTRKEGEWRKQLTKKEGFGPEHPDATRGFKQLLEHLRDREALRAALHAAEHLPEPRYTERQWQHLAALRVVLLHLAAELKVEFSDARSIDFVELGLAARRALGRVDAPSELLLALDRRIQHLLVDEFQDTSQSQAELLELLTAGWEHGDGRTLFLVGDPMQSIYRFRDADMSLFLAVKQRGIGDVRLESLTLERNFRSAPPVVAWVNETFARIFPAEDQIAAGVAGFRASVATRTCAGTQQFVATYPLRSRDPREESARVVEILATELARAPTQSIAVLVRSRSHLAGLRERLRAKGWPVHAVEIDALAEQPVAQDLLGLTRALVHLDDRIAWLAVLRAPWCGLSWADLHALCHDAHDRAVWDLVRDPARAARLSTGGRSRLAATRAVLEPALALRAETSFARWIERTWRELDGPACLDHPDEVRVAEQFFALLSRERLGDLDDPARLQDALTKVQPQSDPPRGQGIEIMTMHRAKGLEFDTVVLLGLGRDPPPDVSQALHWLERVAADGTDDLLLAPTLDDEASEQLTDFVRAVDAGRDRAERARLLYVAATRARERLHVVCQLSPSKPRPGAESLLAFLWPIVGAQLEALAQGADAAPPAEEQSLEPVLRRLLPREPPHDAAPQFALPFDALPAAAAAAARPEFAWASPAAAHVGTVVHRQLQKIAELGVESWTAGDIEARAAAFTHELRLLGVDQDEIAAATARVVAALRSAVDDPQGRWVLGAHTEARSELRLTLRVGDRLEHVRLDRTFVADGTRWIVDFKTSRHEGSDAGAFLESEVERYRPQLDRYAAALATIDARPVQVGLYFPLLRTLRAWPASPKASP